jgi:ATP-binding cassette subfamily B protein
MENKWIMYGGIALKTIGAFLDLAIPSVLKIIIDEVAPTGDLMRLIIWGVIMIVLSISVFVLNIIGNRLASHVARKSTEGIRHELFAKTIRLSARDADHFTVPSLESRITSDTYNIHQFTGMILRMGIRAPILLFGGIFITVFIDPVLTLVMVALLPIIAVSVTFITKKGVPMYTTTQQKLDKMIGVVRENAVGIRVVKALTKYDYEKRRFESANKEHVRAEQTAGMTMSSVNPIMNVILNIGTTLVVLVGAYRVYNGLMLPGTIISFIQYFSMISMSMLAVTRMFVMYSKASASANRVSEVIETPENILEESEESFPASEKKDLHIEFRDVVFSYNGRKNNIENISFDLKKGEKLGIIGATGSGKSTIILLLMRFYDIDSGAIYINGKDIRTYPKDELHTMFGVALQNDFVRNGTIRDNVAFDRELSDEELWRGARLAQAESFIKDKEGALDFVLNSKGTNLSGGQKQRILVSRALAGNPDILILDDSSSALDYKTDAALRNAVFAEMKESTVIIVAQRVSSVMQCDKILVIDEGKTIALGTHEELMDSCDIYREISESQMGGEVE